MEIRLIDLNPSIFESDPQFDNVRLTATPTGGAAVPEPASLALLGTGGLGLLGVRHRRRMASA